MTASLYEMARQLARPVARRHLSLAQADASLVVAALRNPEPPYDPLDRAKLAQWIMRRHRDQVETKRVVTAEGVRQVVRTMVTRRPSNQVRAAAHNVNGNEGFPLTEDEVEEIALEMADLVMRMERRGKK